ncbi:MAG: hypothetical protein ACOYBO_00130 [Azonexus sp.]
MSSTPGEFRRAMFTAYGDAVTEDGTGLLVAEGGIRLHFALSSEKPLRVGALQLCTLRVEINVLQGDEQAASALLDRVDRATQRGGG